MFRGRGRGYYAKKFRGGHGNYANKSKYQACPTKALNQCNQYFTDKFHKKYKEATGKQNTQLSQCYKRILCSLSKYPLPILEAKQTTILEGVGDKFAQMFHMYIQERNQEFQDKQEKIEGDSDQKYLTLNQKIIAEDHILKSRDQGKNPILRKRKFAEIENDEREANDTDRELLKASTKRRKKLEGFLDIGSSTWS